MYLLEETYNEGIIGDTNVRVMLFPKAMMTFKWQQCIRACPILASLVRAHILSNIAIFCQNLELKRSIDGLYGLPNNAYKYNMF